MKRMTVACLMVLAVAATAAARPHERTESYASRELEAIAAEQRGRELASVTFADLESWQERLQAAARKDGWVAASAGASFALPGLGQLRNGEPARGALLLGGHLAIGVGTILGSYFLLPADLRFASLDYLRTPAAAVETAWKAHSLLDYLPSLAVGIGGRLLDLGLRIVASHDARALARRRVEAGEAPGAGR